MKPQVRLIISGIMNLLNSIVFIILLFRPYQYKLIFFMTILSFSSNCFYLTSTYVLDLRAYFLKQQALSFMPFMRNHYFKYAMSFSTLVVTGFYLLAIMGPLFLETQHDFTGWLLSVYLHGGVFCFMAFDLFAVDHSFLPTFWFDLMILTLVYLVYLVISIIAVFGFKIFVYKFMEVATGPQMAVAFFLFYLILINAYFIYQWVLKRKFGLITEETPHICSVDSEELTKQSNSFNTSISTIKAGIITTDLIKNI